MHVLCLLLLSGLAAAGEPAASTPGPWSWIVDLFHGGSAGSLPLALALTIGLGAALGHLRIAGVSLGITTVLFVGIAWSYLFWDAETIKHQKETLTFVREFGLVLFVYCLGMQVGPGFLASLRSQGLRWNLLAASIVFLGLGCAATAAWVFFGVLGQAWAGPQTVVGVMSGAVTNTPGLSAASTALGDLVKQGYAKDLSELTAVAYAVAYPFGVSAIITAIITLRLLFRIDVKSEHDDYLGALDSGKMKAVNANLAVSQDAATGQSIDQLLAVVGAGVVISRVGRGGEVSVPSPSYRIQKDDLLHAVGEPEAISRLRHLVGHDSETDLRAITNQVVFREIIVSEHAVVGVPLARLDFPGNCGATITRVRRAGQELLASGETRLHFGDRVTAVGDLQGLARLGREIGNNETDLRKPQIIALFVGIALGVLLGQVPIPIPGLPVPVKLGLAGGPLVAALALAHVGHVGKHLNFFIAKSANNLLREFGIALFLACVGLLAGEKFVAAAFSQRGLWWILLSLVITLVPLLVVGVIGRAVFKMNFIPLSGLLAGSNTDPPALAFANQTAGDESPAIAYATVYPLTMLLRIVGAQLFVLILVPILVLKLVPAAAVPPAPAKTEQTAAPASAPASVPAPVAAVPEVPAKP